MTSLPIASAQRNTNLLLAAVFGALALATVAAAVKVGLPALLLLPVAAAALLLVQRPAFAVGLLVTLVVLVETGDDGGLLAADAFYDAIGGGPSPAEFLMVLALAAVGLDALRRRDAVRVPPSLAFALTLFLLAIVSGLVAGSWGGAGVKDLLFAGRHLPYLVIAALLVCQVVRTERDARMALGLLAALAVAKAGLGLLGIASGRGVAVDGSTITFYAPTGNGLALLVLLGVIAALLLRARVPLWLLLGSPLLLASLTLSQRRSFWVGTALGILLLIALASSPLGRRLFVPAVVLAAIGIWALSALDFQAQGPLVERAESLEPSKVAANAEDRYRFDERANVLAEIRRRPVTGLGLAVPWGAERPLPVEHVNGRQYTHMVALWHWLKLGLLGLVAYVAIMLASARFAWLAWRRHRDPLLSVAGLGALCFLLALAVVETTASFTGVDARFTVFMGVVIGLLASIRSLVPETPAPPG